MEQVPWNSNLISKNISIITNFQKFCGGTGKVAQAELPTLSWSREAYPWPYEVEEEGMWMPAKGHATVKNTLCKWVKRKRNLGELKENCKALKSQPVEPEISWAYSPRIPPSVISKCQRCAQGLPSSWNSLFFEIQIWVPGTEGSCIMLWLGKLDLSRDHNTVASYQPLLRASLWKVPCIITRPDGY